MPKVESETDARQGSRGKPVLYVLIASLLLAVVYFVGMMTWSGTTAPPDHASQSQSAARETATGSTAKPAASEPPGNPSTPQPAQPKAQ